MVDLGEMKRKANLSTSLEKLRDLHDRAFAYLEPMDTEEQQVSLLIIERLVLGTLGHLATIRFGHNDWSGGKCSVCGVPLEAKGQAVCLISRWENSSVMLCLCETHSRETFEVDVDVLTGKWKSQIGHT
jgi:hypothetical protein